MTPKPSHSNGVDLVVIFRHPSVVHYAALFVKPGFTLPHCWAMASKYGFDDLPGRASVVAVFLNS